MSGNSKTDGDVPEPGRPALIERLNHLWRLDKYNHRAACDVLDDPRSVLTALAIPLEKAQALWGYEAALGEDAAPAIELSKNLLPALVFDALENCESWALSAQGGYITAVQFLAVIFWVLQTDETTPDDEKKIVEQWADLLRSASHQRGRGLNTPLPHRLVTPRDSVTRIPSQTKAPDGWDWSLLVSDADNFLTANDLDFSVRKIASYWLTGDVADLKDDAAPEVAASPVQPARAQGADWTGEMLAAQRAVFDADGKGKPMLRMVALTGIPERKIRLLIAEFKVLKASTEPAGPWRGLQTKKR